jgi:hypothetical protein
VRERGWMVISEVATPRLIDRLTKAHLPEVLASIGSEKKTHLTGMTLPFRVGGATWTTTGFGISLDFCTQLIRTTRDLPYVPR